MNTLQATSAESKLTADVFAQLGQHRWTTALALPLVVGPVWCVAWSTHIGWIGSIAGFVLLATLVVSAVTDFRKHRIYNFVTYSAFLWALVINTAASLLSMNEASSAALFAPAEVVGPAWLGGVGLTQCLAGAGICFAFTLVAFHLSGGGAGDVKIATVVGAFLGLYQGVFAIGFSYIIAALAMGLWTFYSNGPIAFTKAIIRASACWLATRLARFGIVLPITTTAADIKILFTPIPLGPFFAIGTILLVLDRVLA